jgi:hypothetical protein
MALRGSLLEFELPDIFQLIGNESKTGQLVLSNKDFEAFAIFFRGSIVSAGNTTANLQTILFKYIIDIKHYSEQELNELLYLCQGEMRLFTQELVNKRYLTKEELAVIGRMSVEDIVCSLFQWENGHYRFDSLDDVDDYVIGGVMLSVDAVTMEAMRRVDEWKRIKTVIVSDAVFVRTPPNSLEQRGQPAIASIMDPAGCIISLVNGVSSVSALCQKSFFTEYRVHEILFDLWQNNRISPLKIPSTSTKILTPLKTLRQTSRLRSAIALFILTHVLALVIVAAGFILQNVVFLKMTRSRIIEKSSLSTSFAETKIRIATMQFHCLTGALPANLEQLFSSGLISMSDIARSTYRQSDQKEVRGR